MLDYTSVVPLKTEPSPQEDLIDADQAVIDRVIAGDRNAFGILIQRYSDPLYRHAFGMTGSADVAEDILQVSFIKAFHHLAEVRGRFDAWVFRIVANGCKDWLKNIRRSLPASLREAFVMKHVEGRSYEEMAVLLDATVGALKMRVHRAREALQKLLEERYS